MAVTRQAWDTRRRWANGGCQGRNARGALFTGDIVRARHMMDGENKQRHHHQQGKHATPAWQNGRGNGRPDGARETMRHAVPELIEMTACFKLGSAPVS